MCPCLNRSNRRESSRSKLRPSAPLLVFAVTTSLNRSNPRESSRSKLRPSAPLLIDDEVDPPISGAALSDHEGVELTDDEVDPPISGAALSDHEGV